jgi:steroid delta-isomerase
MPVTPAEVRDVVQKYVEAWRSGDKQLLLSIFAEDATWCDPVGTPPLWGMKASLRSGTSPIRTRRAS